MVFESMFKFAPAEEQLEVISRGVANLTPIPALLKKLSQNRPLVIKLGADPTAPDLHLGHAVVLEKMRQFQDLGHQIVFLIGDFTARIGDPTGRLKTRPPLSDEQIKINAKTYMEQLGRILDVSKLRVVYNSELLGNLGLADVIKILSRSTLAQVTAREDFAKRIAADIPVRFDELFYPMMQAYDSVALSADVELGGTDQTFNLLFGRHLQEQFGQEPQVVLTMPILEGLDGVEKMSKSLGNYVGLSDSADSAFAKLMSINDSLVFKYAELLLGWSAGQLRDAKSSIEAGLLHPMNFKKDVAEQIVAKFWSAGESKNGRALFERVVQNQDYSNVAQIDLKKELVEGSCWIVDLMRISKAIETSSEAKRLIEAGAVVFDGQSIVNFKEKIIVKDGSILVVGKKFAKKIRLN